MEYRQADIRHQALFSLEDCYEAGRIEGLASGSAEMKPLQRDFGPADHQLAMGHFVLGGVYVEVRAASMDFASDEHFQAWLQGFLKGVGQANARLGLMAAVDYNDGRGPQHSMFIHRLPTSDGEILN